MKVNYRPSLFRLVYCFAHFYSYIAGDVIQVFNDGPATFDTPITFRVFNSYQTIAPHYDYRFKFTDFPDKNTVITTSASSVRYSVTFPSTIPIEKEYMIEVDVWYRFMWSPVYSIGTVVSTFQLKESLLGTIVYEQAIPGDAIKRNFVSTEGQVNLTAKIHDPTEFFSSANITYNWTINGSPEAESLDATTSTNFTKPQLNNITVVVFATLNTSNSGLMQKNGSFDLSLTSLDPIHDLTADGHTNVELFRDESLQLTMKIDGGSPPFWYCWRIEDKPENDTSLMVPYCTKTNENFFIITRYFDAKGKKNLITDVSNEVSALQKNLTILIYEIEHRAQLSFILIPVCSIILAIFIIIAGIAIHMRQRRELSIEVADFDFQSYDEMIERTFFERIRDNFTQSWKISIFRPCGSRTVEYDDFVDKNDSDEIVPGGEPNISECNLRFSGDLNDSGVSTDIRT